QHGPHLAQQRESHDPAHVNLGAELRQELAHLQRQHHAGKNGGQIDDVDRLHAHRVELIEQQAAFERSAHQVAEKIAGQYSDFAKLVEEQVYSFQHLAL